jgi:hypothetical protein
VPSLTGVRDLALRGDVTLLPSRQELTRPGIGRWTPDLILLSILVAATAAFGRPFSKLGVGGVLYVTELAIVVMIAFAVHRCGVRGVLFRVGRVPVIPLLALWLVGAVATLRGLPEYGLSGVTHDIGLVEYSVFIPLVAVIIDDHARAAIFIRLLALAGLVATLVFTIVLLVDPYGPLGLSANPNMAVGIYLSLLVLWVAAAGIHGRRPSVLELSAAAAALPLMAVAVTRTNIVALTLALVVLVVLALRRWFAVLIAASALAFSVLGAASLQAVGVGQQPTDVGQPSATVEQPSAEQPSTTVEQPSTSIPGALEETVEEPHSAEGANARWRLAYWKHLLTQVPEDPLVGVGFGHPSAFRWRGTLYDGRNDPRHPFDVTPPHNSFVNLLYRTGIVGALAVLWLVTAALVRLVRRLRAGPPPDERIQLVTLACLFTFIAVTASFSGALEGPFMGIFFWIVLGLLLVLPRLAEPATDARTAANGDSAPQLERAPA